MNTRTSQDLLDFSGRHVFVAGGSSGINLAIADAFAQRGARLSICLLYTSPSPRDGLLSRMPSSA